MSILSLASSLKSIAVFLVSSFWSVSVVIIGGRGNKKKKNYTFYTNTLTIYIYIYTPYPEQHKLINERSEIITACKHILSGKL